METLTIKLNAVQVLALACFGVAMGSWIKDRWKLLDRLNVPAPVVGGLVYALAALALRDRVANFDLDLVLRDILMVAFFTTIGLSASLRLIKQGGKQVLLFYGLAAAGAVIQNVLGVGLAKLLGLDALLGVIAGSVSMAGGPATALAFGSTFERMGVSGGTAVALAAATFGIVAGGLLGGFVGGRLIEGKKLRPAPPGDPDAAEAIVYAGDAPPMPVNPMEGPTAGEHTPLFRNVVAIAVAMGLGAVISGWFERLGIVLPAYVGAMMAAAVLRNLDDRFHVAGISQHQVDTIGNISLNVFIVMALLTLRLWELVHLALPMLAILMVQVALVWALSVAATYRLMGRDFDAAVMAGGYCGFMLGTTANAVACMEVLTAKYGPAARAFIVVPLVGAFLIDFTNVLVISWFLNLLR